MLRAAGRARARKPGIGDLQGGPARRAEPVAAMPVEQRDQVGGETGLVWCAAPFPPRVMSRSGLLAEPRRTSGGCASRSTANSATPSSSPSITGQARPRGGLREPAPARADQRTRVDRRHQHALGARHHRPARGILEAPRDPERVQPLRPRRDQATSPRTSASGGRYGTRRGRKRSGERAVNRASVGSSSPRSRPARAANPQGPASGDDQRG